MTLPLRWERSFVVILLAVCGMHFGLIGYLLMQPSTHLQRLTRKPVQVQSIQLQPAISAPAKACPQSAPPVKISKPVAPTPEFTAEPAPAAATPVPKKNVKKPEAVPKVPQKEVAKPALKSPEKPAVKKDKEKGKEKEKKAPPPPSEVVAKKPKIAADKIAQVRSDLKKIQHGEIVASRPTATSPIENTSVIAGASDSIPTYEETLSDRLRLLLTLPDFGDVKISLTLDRKGKVVTLKILKSDSEENRHYVEKILPSLSLPRFGRSFGTEANHTFQLVLSN